MKITIYKTIYSDTDCIIQEKKEVIMDLDKWLKMKELEKQNLSLKQRLNMIYGRNNGLYGSYIKGE